MRGNLGTARKDAADSKSEARDLRSQPNLCGPGSPSAPNNASAIQRVNLRADGMCAIVFSRLSGAVRRPLERRVRPQVKKRHSNLSNSSAVACALGNWQSGLDFGLNAMIHDDFEDCG